VSVFFMEHVSCWIPSLILSIVHALEPASEKGQQSCPDCVCQSAYPASLCTPSSLYSQPVQAPIIVEVNAVKMTHFSCLLCGPDFPELVLCNSCTLTTSILGHLTVVYGSVVEGLQVWPSVSLTLDNSRALCFLCV
jgi:hypothetical protein